MKLFLNVFLLLTFAVCVFVNNLSIEEVILLLLATGMHMLIMGRYAFVPNLCKYVILFTFWISVVMMPGFHLVYHILEKYVNVQIGQIDYDRIISFGVKVYFISTLSFLILGRMFRKRVNNRKQYEPLKIPEGIIIIFFIFLYGLSMFCYALGLGRMGADAVELPFHLSGVINLFRKIFVPLFFAMLVENHIVRRVKFPTKFYALYGIWCLLEVFAWMSKSILFTHLEPLLIILFLYYRPTIKTMSRYMIPIAFVVLFLYPIIGVMRNVTDGNSISENFTEAKRTADEESDDSGVNPLLKPLNRTFMSAYLYAQDYSYIDKEVLFDFSRFIPIVVLRGAPSYQTFVIDGYPAGANHSSGTSGLMDAMLHGGYGLCYLFIMFIMVLAGLIDRLYPKKHTSIYVILFIIVWEMSNFRNISMLYDSTGLQTLFVRLVAIYIAFRINFRNKELWVNSRH